MLEKLALTDPLTNLANRRSMDRLAEKELRRRDRYPSPLALGLIDVDHFKQINARYLLPGGDKVLVDLAKALQQLPARRRRCWAASAARSSWSSLRKPTWKGPRSWANAFAPPSKRRSSSYKDEIISVRISLGFAVVGGRTCKPISRAMKHLASVALSEAKNTGRNRCVFHVMPKLPFEQAG